MASFSPVYSIKEIPQQRWQTLLAQADNTQPGLHYPFLDYRFLLALEQHQCIDAQQPDPLAASHSGWLVHYLVAKNNAGEIDQILPAFIKQHSYGEYVFDWSWADAYQRHGFDYYPKLLLAAPFTPASGPRRLGRPDADWSGVCDALQQHCATLGLSGWHLNFIMPDSHQLLSQQAGVLPRMACQFHWYNRQYQHFDHYLEGFTSRKRKAVRKERQKVTQQGLTLVRKTGNDIQPDDIDVFYQCYQMTYALRRSRGYLNRGFFQQLRDTLSEQMMLVMACDQHQQPQACALYFFDQHTLYGRYWGALQEFDALHFEACYYQGIEFCIERGLQRFDPGTQGEHKISRGFEPTLTYSGHQLMHPQFQQAVADFVAQERRQVLLYRDQASTLLPFKNTQDEP